jgi:hypothetical protein
MSCQSPCAPSGIVRVTPWASTRRCATADHTADAFLRVSYCAGSNTATQSRQHGCELLHKVFCADTSAIAATGQYG